MSKLMEKVNVFLGRRLNEKGQEVPDPTPVALPVGYKKPPTLEERIKSMIRDDLSVKAAADGYETWEEANDFDVGDEDGDRTFNDEDDEVTPNDPFVEQAARHAEQDLIEKASKLPPEPRKAAKGGTGQGTLKKGPKDDPKGPDDDSGEGTEEEGE